eukprot:gnl/TRDRNA2_/TRDRNA2_80140_c0_seq1.p1 gnl/TRDRNA2_/TRDRNA2_80140_c0~~gnl/TRDRNA2_/TRDRNA2_80140_c0_seq1.p1  ORF type:complete len:403 (-),score=76.34 gnl/TRDRNA2_/TRDRNA2_80140_c0_seq1:222-1430(-)
MDVHPPWTSELPPAAPPPAPAAQKSSVQVDDNGVTYEVPTHYQFLRCLGRGTYGSVAAFRDTLSGEELAIKKIQNPFRNQIDGKRCLREIKLLRLLQHDCIIVLHDILAPPSLDFHEVYLVTELMDADLHTVISSDQPLTDDHVQFFIYHILRALLYMHSANVVHRDLKPLNVLVNKNCDIKICDFGLARGRAGFSHEDDDFLRTEYIGTRWYRAPEVVLTSMEYTAAIDIWSAGCILGELIGKRPLFPGKDFLDQIGTICEVLGTPTDEELAFIPPQNEAARVFIKTKFAQLPRKHWSFGFASDSQHELLDKLLKFDPNHRLSAYDALRHPYLEEHHNEEDEPVAPGYIDWSFDDIPHDVGKLQCMVYHEAAALHPDILDRDHDALLQRGWGRPQTPSTES